jgi:hypothetical protein
MAPKGSGQGVAVSSKLLIVSCRGVLRLVENKECEGGVGMVGVVIGLWKYVPMDGALYNGLGLRGYERDIVCEVGLASTTLTKVLLPPRPVFWE